MAVSLLCPFMKIYTIDLGFMGVERSIAAYAVEGPEGVVLIEAGPYSTWEALQNGLLKQGFHIEQIRSVFLSHIHFDHAGAAWALAEKGATIYVHPLGLPHLAAPEKLYNSAKQIYGDQMEVLWGKMEPIPLSQLYAPEHGEIIETCGLRLTAWYTPGHAVHHIAWEVA
jgi:glyoxylase-like metal-dependent hydrolase (beta-lactamase superfamily II)